MDKWSSIVGHRSWAGEDEMRNRTMMLYVVIVALLLPLMSLNCSVSAKKIGGSPTLYWFEGNVRDEQTIDTLGGISIKVTYNWPIGGPHTEYTSTTAWGSYVLHPEHEGINTVYTIWANYPNQDGSHWIERREVTFPTGYTNFYLLQNTVGYLYTTETYANTAHVETIKYTKTTSHSEKAYAYVAVGPGFGYDKTTSSLADESVSSPVGKSLQVRVPYMSTGVYSLYPGSIRDKILEQSWLIGDPIGPKETGSFKADTMKRPGIRQNQNTLSPGYPWEGTQTFAASHTHQNGVEIGLGASFVSQKFLAVDYQKTSSTTEEMHWKIVNTDVVPHTYEYYWDGWDLHLWMVR
jgi:hypothetical protein